MHSFRAIVIMTKICMEVTTLICNRVYNAVRLGVQDGNPG